MTIEQLREGTIMVTLMRDDMEWYSIDFSDENTENVRRGLTRLMMRVGRECGLSYADKSYLIEALPGGDCCLLLITARTVKRRRIYRIKRRATSECCTFLSADELIDFLSSGAGFGYRLYEYGGYRLLPDRPLSPSVRGLLNEYGSVCDISTVEAARIREHGRLIREKSGINPILRLIQNSQ